MPILLSMYSSAYFVIHVQFKIGCSYHDLDKESEETKENLLLKYPLGVLPCLEDSDKRIFGA